MYLIINFDLIITFLENLKMFSMNLKYRVCIGAYMGILGVYMVGIGVYMLWIARTTRRRVRARPTVALMRTGSSRSTDRPTTISANVRIRQNIAKMCAL